MEGYKVCLHGLRSLPPNQLAASIAASFASTVPLPSASPGFGGVGVYVTSTLSQLLEPERTPFQAVFNPEPSKYGTLISWGVAE